MIDGIPLWVWIVVIMGLVIVLRVVWTSGDGE
jgi:hypothetical protein